jgi:hypothetical protein
MTGEAAPSFSADDLALLGDNSGAGDAGGDKSTDDKAAQADAKAQPDAAAKAVLADGKPKTLLNGADPDATDKAKEAEQKPYWPDDWREKMAKETAGEDQKAYAKELKRLQRFSTPVGVYGFAREYEGKFDRGGLVKLPGKDAKPEELAEFQKAFGWAEKPGEMFAQIELANGAVIGEMDKPLMNGFLEAVHGATSAQQVVSKAANWYLKQQEQLAADLDQKDDEFLRTSTRELKEELGPKYDRVINNISSLHRFHPRGREGFEEMITGRDSATGQIIANNPELVRMFVALSQEVNPVGSVVEDSAGGVMSVQNELASIQKMRTEEPKRYWSDVTQKRELELLNVLEKEKNRARA